MKQGNWDWGLSLLGLVVMLGASWSYAWWTGSNNWRQAGRLVGTPIGTGREQVASAPEAIGELSSSIMSLPVFARSLDAAGSGKSPSAPAGSNELLAGGDAVRGADIFFKKSAAMCTKCHRVKGEGGAVGPELTRIGAEKSREYLLESLLEPDKVIAANYSTLLVQLIDGNLVFGVVRERTAQQLRIVDVEAKEHLILVDDIEDQRPGRSAMPADLHKSLSSDEIRDLIEYLASLKGN